MKNKNNKYYIFLDVSTNRCTWDEEDNLKAYGQKNNPQEYTMESKTSVGKDAVDGLNVLINYARITLGKEPVLVLCAPKNHGRQSQIFAGFKRNLKALNLSNCEIDEYPYLHYSDTANLGKAISVKLYYDTHKKDIGKKPGLFDGLYYQYSKKCSDFVVITGFDSCVKDEFTQKEYISYKNLISFEHNPGEALDVRQADAFADLDSFEREITRIETASFDQIIRPTQVEEMSAEALSELDVANDRLFEEMDAFADSVEEASKAADAAMEIERE